MSARAGVGPRVWAARRVVCGASVAVGARVVVAAAAAAAIAVYVWIALHRVGYPYELDWMEGGSVELAARVAAGHSLYVAPSLGFVGWTYTPLYYLAAAGVGKLTGVGFLSLRMVSLAASLASMATLSWIVTRETGERIAGLVAAGLFAATFRISGAWFDTGRVDSLFVALTLVALGLGSRARGVRGGLVVGAVAFLAFFTKQSALPAVLPALVLLAIRHRRAGVPALFTLLGAIVVSTALVDGATGGWYRYYIIGELSHQPWTDQAWAGFWVNDVLGHEWPLALVVLGAGVTAVRRLPRSEWIRSPAAYWVAAAAGLIASAWFSRLHTGGYANVLMPAYAATALLAGLSYGWFAAGRAGRFAPGRAGRFAPGRSGRFAPAMVSVTLLIQLALLAYPIGSQIPTTADRLAGAELMARLRTLRGPVLVLRHPWYATLAGKGSFAQEEGIGDVLRSADQRGATALRASLRDALNVDHIQTVVLDGRFDAALLGPELHRDFRLESQPVTPARLYPLTDVRTSPTLLYTRVRAASQPVS